MVMAGLATIMANIVAIIPIRLLIKGPDMGGIAVLRTYGKLLPVFLVGMVLVVLAVPRVVAYAYAAQTQSFEEQSDQDMPDLSQRIAALRSGTNWLSGDNRLQQNLGEALLAEARRSG